MNNSFLDGGRSRRAAVILIVAVSALALVIAIAALVLANRGPADTALETPRPNATVNVPAGPLTKLKGERTVEGVSVGYPHTTAGAVSAAAEYMTQLGSTLDLDRIRTLAPLVADSSYADSAQRLVQARVESRKQLGVAESGPVPVGVSMTIGPAAYQLRATSPDQMTVLLLAYLTTVDNAGTLTPRVIVMPVDMRWDGTDWKLMAPGASSNTDFSALVAQPGTPDAAAKGWQVIQP